MDLSKDLREFVEFLGARGVEFIVVGSYARAFYGEPRYTADIDFFVRPTSENGERLVRALEDFGFESLGLEPEDFCEAGVVVQLGTEPNRIDLLTGIEGVSFEEAWQERQPGEISGLEVCFISRRLFVKNKLALGRPKDLDDVQAVQE
jgi:predicted nucleotidyltransferase